MRGVKCPYDFRGGGRSPTVVDAADTADLDVTISYTGRQVQTWTAPYSGYYYVEAYGAAGGEDASRGGYGGYVKMYTYLNEGTNLYITCGQKGWMQYGNAAKVSADNPTYNGGGRAGYSTVDSQNSAWFSGVGGGATSIALSNHGELKDFVNYKNDVLMVAGGGAGGSSKSSGSGGLVLYAGSGTNYSVINGADTSLLNGQFALGSNPGTNDGGGGGGGWIGGKSGLDTAGNSAGGGASFVNTSQNCVPIELIPDYNTKDGYVHITSTDYTGYYTISYDYDSGTANNPISYNITQDDFTLTAPTKEGYTFTGWTGSNGDTPQKDVTIKKGTAENLSFKANWNVNYYWLDLNAVIDGRAIPTLPDGCTCDVYINGQLAKSGVNDFFKQYPYGTIYEFKNFQTKVGLVFANKTQTNIQNGSYIVSNGQSFKGVVKGYYNSPTDGETTIVLPIYTTKSVVTTFHRNTSLSDTQTTSQTFTYGVANQKFAANTFKRDGYKFAGWAFNKNATKIDYPDLCIVADSWIDFHYPKTDLYAVWEPNHYTIKYDANGGTGTMADQNITYSDTNMTNTTKCEYMKNGYLFNGWYASRINGGKIQYLYQSPSGKRGEWYNEGNQPSGYILYKYSNGEETGHVTIVDKDVITFHAQWKPITWTVKYDANGGTGTMVDSKHVYESGSKLNKNQFSKTGYTFNGWQASRVRDGKTEWLCANTDNSWIDGNEWYEKDKIPSNRKIFYFYDCQIMQISTYIDGDVITMHALWNANTYTNQIGHWAEGFKYREGNNDNKNALRLKDTYFSASYKSNIVMDSAKAVKTPNGYYLRSLGTPEFNGTFKSYSIGLKLIQKPASMWFEYYYDPISYSITYNLNGGANNSANPSTYNVLYGVSLKAPTRAGYTFTGWYDENGNKVTGINEGCNAKFNSAEDLYTKLAARTTGNRTLTAHWSYNPISVKVPQILTGDHTGKSQFRVKCDSIVVGNIAVEPDSSFNYTQDKLAVRAAIKRKSSNNVIDKNNHSVVYDIITDKPLTAGCWQGNFNIKLTLTKE